MNRGVLLAAAAAAVLAVTPALAEFHGGARGFHGPPAHGFHGRPPSFHHGSGGRVFLHVWGPLFPPWSPYYAPYPVYAYPPPPAPPDEGWSAPPPDGDADDEAPLASYGLVQLRGIPDGAVIDLDGRFWLTASQLERRWLALPEGEHRLTVRLEGAEPIDRSIEVRAGKTEVVRLGPFPRAPA